MAAPTILKQRLAEILDEKWDQIIAAENINHVEYVELSVNKTLKIRFTKEGQYYKIDFLVKNK